MYSRSAVKFVRLIILIHLILFCLFTFRLKNLKLILANRKKSNSQFHQDLFVISQIEKNPTYPEYPPREIWRSLDLLDYGDFSIISDALNGDFEKNGYFKGKFSEEIYESATKQLIVSFNHISSLTDRDLI